MEGRGKNKALCRLWLPPETARGVKDARECRAKRVSRRLSDEDIQLTQEPVRKIMYDGRYN